MFSFSDKIQSQQDCDCVGLRSCRWSLDAVNELEGLSRNDPKYKDGIAAIKRHICDAKTRSIYCCGPEQQPPSTIKSPSGYTLHLNGKTLKTIPRGTLNLFLILGSHMICAQAKNVFLEVFFVNPG